MEPALVGDWRISKSVGRGVAKKVQNFNAGFVKPILIPD